MVDNKTVIRYHHLAVVCSNVPISKAFYAKVGFHMKHDDPLSHADHGNDTKDTADANDDGNATPTILYNLGGLELHLFQTNRPHPDNQNILMDFPDKKYPGHTHMSFGVGSVAGAKKYFEESGIPLSGSRQERAVFIRDPDRTVLEFERNDGGDDEKPVSAATLAKAPRGGIDHIGTRVSNPHQAVEWYQTNLGFAQNLTYYEPNLENPLKNHFPWILQTKHGKGEEIDINLILNATVGQQNELLETGKNPLPGILYACYIVENVETILVDLPPKLVARTEQQLRDWGLSLDYVNKIDGCKQSCFVRDLDHNLYRLVEL